MWLKNIMVINTVFAIIESSRGTKNNTNTQHKERGKNNEKNSRTEDEQHDDVHERTE
jgi:hypothetical protein